MLIKVNFNVEYIPDNFLGRCPVCLTNQIKMAAECGHAYCFACAARLKNCAICRAQKKSLRKIYLSGANSGKEDEAAHKEKKRKCEEKEISSVKPIAVIELEEDSMFVDDDAW
jgi:hypothetical protein